MNAESLDWSVLAPALAAGLLVLASHVPLGIEVLRRGIIFIDLAVAQFAALGVIAAQIADWDQPLAVQGCAAFAALAGAGLLTQAERRWPQMQEALIGLSFVLAASVAMLLLSGNPHGGEHLKDLLGGQILWVGGGQLLAVAAAAAVVLLIRWRGGLAGRGFYFLFALAVTLSVQVVGVYLVFASLIAPAVATRGVPSGGLRLAASLLLGATGYALGLLASARYDLPSGSAIVCAMCLLSLLVLLARRDGRIAAP